MADTFVFIFKYFWLFASISLILVGDILFIMKSIQDTHEIIIKYKKENKDKSFLKGKFTPPIICIICNIVLIVIVISLLLYCKEVIDMREIIKNMEVVK